MRFLYPSFLCSGSTRTGSIRRNDDPRARHSEPVQGRDLQSSCVAHTYRAWFIFLLIRTNQERVDTAPRRPTCATWCTSARTGSTSPPARCRTRSGLVCARPSDARSGLKIRGAVCVGPELSLFYCRASRKNFLLLFQT